MVLFRDGIPSLSSSYNISGLAKQFDNFVPVRGLF